MIRGSIVCWVCLATLAPLLGARAATETAPRVASPEHGRLSVSRGGRLVAGLAAEPKHFNPLVAVDLPTKTVVNLLMADLLHIDRELQTVEENLALSWEVSDGGKRYLLTIRDGVRFSDGHRMDVEDVLFSFRAYLDEKSQSPQRNLLVVGGEPVRVKRVDDRRVEFLLKAPYAAGERLFDSFYVMPHHVLGEIEPDQMSSQWGLLSKPERVVGLGPFRLKSVVPGERVVLERNPYYWKKDEAGDPLPYLDEIVFVVAPSEDALTLQFRANQTHVIERLSPPDFDRFTEESEHRQMRDLGAGLEYNFLFFNLDELRRGALAKKHDWFRRTEFRRAISAAIDRSAIARLVYNDRAAPLATHVTPGNRLWLNRAIRPEPQSETVARRRMAKAGFSWEPDGTLVDESGERVEFSILINAGNRRREMMASLIQEDLRLLGIDVTVAKVEFSSYIERIFRTREFEASLLAIGSSDADPNPEMPLLLSDGEMHVWHLEKHRQATDWEAEIDRLMNEQLVTLDYTQRKALYDRVQRIIFEQQPIIGLVSPHLLVGADARLGNFRPGVLPPYTLWNAEELYFSGPKE